MRMQLGCVGFQHPPRSMSREKMDLKPHDSHVETDKFLIEMMFFFFYPKVEK